MLLWKLHPPRRKAVDSYYYLGNSLMGVGIDGEWDGLEAVISSCFLIIASPIKCFILQSIIGEMLRVLIIIIFMDSSL